MVYTDGAASLRIVVSPARYAYSVGLKPSVSVSSGTLLVWNLEPYKTGAFCRLPRHFWSKYIFLFSGISVFGQSITVDQSELPRISSLISLQPVFCFPVSFSRVRRPDGGSRL